MRFVIVLLTSFALLASTVTSFPQNAPQAGTVPQGSTQPTGTPEKRIAFVVGNESYAAGALPTA